MVPTPCIDGDSASGLSFLTTALAWDRPPFITIPNADSTVMDEQCRSDCPPPRGN